MLIDWDKPIDSCLFSEVDGVVAGTDRGRYGGLRRATWKFEEWNWHHENKKDNKSSSSDSSSPLPASSVFFHLKECKLMWNYGHKCKSKSCFL